MQLQIYVVNSKYVHYKYPVFFWYLTIYINLFLGFRNNIILYVIVHSPNFYQYSFEQNKYTIYISKLPGILHTASQRKVQGLSTHCQLCLPYA